MRHSLVFWADGGFCSLYADTLFITHSAFVTDNADSETLIGQRCAKDVKKCMMSQQRHSARISEIAADSEDDSDDERPLG